MNDLLEQDAELKAQITGQLPTSVAKKIEFARRLGLLAKAASEWSTDALASPHKPLDGKNVDWFCDQIEALVKDLRKDFGSAQSIKK